MYLAHGKAYKIQSTFDTDSFVFCCLLIKDVKKITLKAFSEKIKIKICLNFCKNFVNFLFCQIKYCEEIPEQLKEVHNGYHFENVLRRFDGAFGFKRNFSRISLDGQGKLIFSFIKFI